MRGFSQFDQWCQHNNQSVVIKASLTIILTFLLHGQFHNRLSEEFKTLNLRQYRLLQIGIRFAGFRVQLTWRRTFYTEASLQQILSGEKVDGGRNEKEERHEIVSVIYRWEMTAPSAAERCRPDNVLRQQVRQVPDLNAELHASNNLDL